MSHTYTEDSLVEQPAIQLFSEMGWETVSTLDKVFGVSGTLGRETKSEVLLVSRLRGALERLNPNFPQEEICAAMDECSRELLPTLLFEQDLLAD